MKIIACVGHCPASFCLRLGRYGTPELPQRKQKSARTVNALSITFIIKQALNLYDRYACTSEAHIFVVI